MLRPNGGRNNVTLDKYEGRLFQSLIDLHTFGRNMLRPYDELNHDYV